MLTTFPQCSFDYAALFFPRVILYFSPSFFSHLWWFGGLGLWVGVLNWVLRVLVLVRFGAHGLGHSGIFGVEALCIKIKELTLV